MAGEPFEAAGFKLPDDPDPVGPGFVLHVPSRDEVDRVWREYWRPLLSGVAGEETGALERLKGELYDAWYLVNQARLVYRHVTGGLCDDLTASAEGIIATADRRVAELLERARAR